MRCPAKFSFFLKENIVIELNSNIFVECTLTLHRHTDVLLWKNNKIYLLVQRMLVYTNTSFSCILRNSIKKKCVLTVIWVLWELLYRKSWITVQDSAVHGKSFPYGDKSRVTRLQKISKKSQQNMAQTPQQTKHVCLKTDRSNSQ